MRKERMTDRCGEGYRGEFHMPQMPSEDQAHGGRQDPQKLRHNLKGEGKG
jgi:hypothetical protein